MVLHAQIPKPPKDPPPEPVRKPNGEPPEDPLEPPDERPPSRCGVDRKPHDPLIFVIGGVVSSVSKALSVASIQTARRRRLRGTILLPRRLVSVCLPPGGKFLFRASRSQAAAACVAAGRLRPRNITAESAEVAENHPSWKDP